MLTHHFSTVTITVDGDGSSNPFKGFLVQARQAADATTSVGSFAVVDTNSQLSRCSPENVRIYFNL